MKIDTAFCASTEPIVRALRAAAQECLDETMREWLNAIAEGGSASRDDRPPVPRPPR
jgi:hypothetical protein